MIYMLNMQLLLVVEYCAWSMGTSDGYRRTAGCSSSCGMCNSRPSELLAWVGPYLWIVNANDLMSTVSYQTIVSPVQCIHNSIDAAADELRGNTHP
jgi:hypothetical protein